MNNKRFLSKLILTLLSLTISLSFITPVLAQSEAAVIFLLLSPSPQANAMGLTYGNNVSTSPMATIFNPASLGLFAQKNFIGTSYYPQKIKLLPPYLDTNYDAGNTSIGINLKDFIHIPLSIGVAFHRVRFGIDEQIEVNPGAFVTYSSWDEVNGTTFSIALDYYVRASFGYTKKTIESHLAPIGVGSENGSGEANAHDIGLIVEFPVYDIFRKSNLIQDIKFKNIEPFLNPAIYYSKTNIGDKIAYLDGSQADLIPRNLSLGINFNTGLTYKGRYSNFNLFSFKWAREVDDILIKRNEDHSREYVSGPHDIKFWDNLIMGKSNDKIIAKKGYEFNFGDFYFIRNGKYEDINGNMIFKTKGWGINYTQPVKILATLLNLDNNMIVKLISNIKFEEHYSESDFDLIYALYSRGFKSYVIRLENLPLDNLF